jgi:apolipoprotein N-acyltransferase
VTEWLTSGLSQWLSDMWVIHYDPFYGYVFLGLLIIVAATWVAWFFDILRPIAGAISVGVVAFLFGFRKGQHVEKDRQAARDRREERAERRWRPW